MNPSAPRVTASSPLSSLQDSSPITPSGLYQSSLSSTLPGPSTSSRSPSPTAHIQQSAANQEGHSHGIPRRRRGPVVASTEQKLRSFAQLLREYDWSVRQFLEAWVGKRVGSQNIVLDLRGSRTPSQRRAAVQSATCAIFGGDSGSFRSLEVELEQLVGQPYFGAMRGYENEENPGGVYQDISTFNYGPAVRIVQEQAPIWYRLLIQLLQNRRNSWESYEGYAESSIDSDLAPRVFAITSMVLHSRAQHRSSTFHGMITLFLASAGVKRRVMEVLAKLGFTHGYRTGLRLWTGVATNARRYLREVGSNPQVVVVYDNINFKDMRRDEIVGHQSQMLSLTNALAFICPQLPREGLRIDMHDATVPLDVNDIFNAPFVCGNDQGVSVQISRSHITDAIRLLHPTAVGQIFSGDAKPRYPRMPVVEVLPARKTDYWQLGGIFEDESTIEGTYNVLKRIFVDYFGLKRSETPDAHDDPYRTRLWCVHGDQLTSQRIRLVKAEQVGAELPYDRKDWVLGIPAWFHIQLNLMNTIIRTHWGPVQKTEEDIHTLIHDITAWNRSYTNRGSAKFYQMDPLFRQSFTSRVCALFYDAMRDRGYLGNISEGDLCSSLDEAISRLTPDHFLQLVDDVQTKAFTLTAWTGSKTGEDSPHKDLSFRTMCRFLQELELFLTIRYAIKHGDIGLLRLLVDPLIIVFFGAEQSNYGNEMLYYRWLLSDGVSTPELQYSILASGLMNWPGRSNGFKPTDLAMEHINAACKNDMKCHKNSTHDVDATFDRLCLTGTWMRQLRTAVESLYGEQMSGKHTQANTGVDIGMLALKLFTGRFVHQRPRERLGVPAPRMFDSKDIYRDGLDILAGKVREFNRLHVRDRHGFAEAYPRPNIDGDTINETEEQLGELDDDLDMAMFDVDV